LEITVPDIQFDSFGEPLSRGHLIDVKPQGRASRWTMWAGTTVFWSLVVAILSARVFYFDPDFAAKFSQVAKLTRSVAAVFGV
jgi:hypothetical protein